MDSSSSERSPKLTRSCKICSIFKGAPKIVEKALSAPKNIVLCFFIDFIENFRFLM